MQNYQNLEVWRKAHQLVLMIYGQKKFFPIEEKFGLNSQIRRAAVSITTNIVEGAGRKSKNEFARFLEISFASACEVEYELMLVRDLQLINEKSFLELQHQIIEIKKMLSGLIQKVLRV